MKHLEPDETPASASTSVTGPVPIEAHDVPEPASANSMWSPWIHGAAHTVGQPPPLGPIGDPSATDDPDQACDGLLSMFLGFSS